ncbi:hypothetical protein R1flu_010727 [Riccia fluitans]|uniref:monogalactosyldiacylglycerol synthase n=1 Tax=Riccia fluitans TaxID=41844 RepID=A0ABD1Z5T4_9MARC
METSLRYGADEKQLLLHAKENFYVQEYSNFGYKENLNIRRAFKKKDHRSWKSQEGQYFATLTVACVPRRRARLVEALNKLIRRGTERVPLGGVPFGGALLGRDDISRGEDCVPFESTGHEDKDSLVDPGRPKRVLILMSDTGGGHRASAEAIKATFELEFGVEYDVTVIDLWKDHTPWPFNQVPKTYSFMVKHETLWKLAYHTTAPRFIHQSQMAATSTFIAREVAKGLLKYQPDVIVSVHPLMQHVPIRVLRARGLLNKIPFTTVITDLSTCHPTWFHRSVTRCFCPTKDVEQRALKAGLKPSQIRVHGLPIRPGFGKPTKPKDELRRDLGMSEDLPAVLLMGGGEGMGPVESTARALLEALFDKTTEKPIGQLVVICGRNKKLVNTLKSLDWKCPVQIQGFVTNMVDWMAASDCVISKAGPGTIAEAMIRGLPMVLNSFIAGQEVGNVAFVVDNGAGEYCDKPKEIARIVAEWFGPKAMELQRMAENAKKLGRPDAVFKIVHDIAELARYKLKVQNTQKLVYT